MPLGLSGRERVGKNFGESGGKKIRYFLYDGILFGEFFILKLVAQKVNLSAIMPYCVYDWQDFYVVF